jgi:hypothetical protein
MALSHAILGGMTTETCVRPYQPVTHFSRPYSGHSFGSSQDYNFRMIPHDLLKNEPQLLTSSKNMYSSAGPQTYLITKTSDFSSSLGSNMGLMLSQKTDTIKEVVTEP